MAYVDGFLLPVPVKNLAKYRAIARKAGKIWMEHGALRYTECAGDDLKIPGMLGFPTVVKPRKGETILFSYIVYKTKAQRDRVNKKVMADPRMAKLCDPDKMPFEMKRMAYGGFKTIVDL